MTETTLLRISNALQKAGFSGQIPAVDAALSNFGVDSLMQALWIVEIENTFAVSFSVSEMEGDAFRSFSGVAKLLSKKGVQ